VRQATPDRFPSMAAGENWPVVLTNHVHRDRSGALVSHTHRNSGPHSHANLELSLCLTTAEQALELVIASDAEDLIEEARRILSAVA